MTPLCKLLLGICLCCGLVMPVQAQDGPDHTARHHPPQDQLLHEKFYATWHMPDNPNTSCCNDADCYPTVIKYVDGNVYAKRREDGKYIPIPPEKIESKRDNPDGRNHLCAPPPNAFHPSEHRVLLRARRRHVKFALVNDRTPGKQSSCVLCGEPIETGYLREIGTRLFYCDHDCYADHRKSAVMALASFAKVSLGFLAPSQMKERSEAER